MKPDVMAVGLGSDVMGQDGIVRGPTVRRFSSPIMYVAWWLACGSVA